MGEEIMEARESERMPAKADSFEDAAGGPLGGKTDWYADVCSHEFPCE
jgi:hypothetical protein